MQRNLTWLLFGAAVVLFAVILLFERRLPDRAERRAPKRLLTIVQSVDDIDSIRVTLPHGGGVRAEKNGSAWTLTEPPYAARQIALETFATNLVGLKILDRIPSGDVTREGLKAYGFEPARALVEVQADSNRFRFEIGKIAPLTSNLYLRLPESGDVVLTSPMLLSTLPRDTNDWRTPALVQLSALDFDHIQVRDGQRSFELGRNSTNNTWQITKPVPARADQDRVLELLQTLRSAEATEFVTDAPGTDLERFGLQAPDVELSFLSGTNRVYAIEFGNSPTNRTNQVYAELLGRTNVVLASRDLLNVLKEPYKAFHDPRLVSINPAALDRIIVHSKENFTLQRQPSAAWFLDGSAKMPVDRELFLTRVVGVISALQILDIVKEVPAETELKSFGFLPPTASYAFFQKLTNSSGIATNILSAELAFGAAQKDKIFARRSDENPIYLTQLASMLELPKRAFELRDRKIWRFSTNDVVSLLLANGTTTNKVLRSPVGWSDDVITNAAIDEVVFRLSKLNAQEWVEKGSNRLATFGINTNSLTLSVQLRSAPEPLSLHLGRRTLRQDAYAAIEFPGEMEPTIFEFPGDLYQMILEGLPVPK